MSEFTRWAIEWHSVNKLNGDQRMLLGGIDGLFKTRQAARAHIEEQWGFLRDRPDLHAEPHGWKMPRAVKVRVTIAKIDP